MQEVITDDSRKGFFTKLRCGFFQILHKTDNFLPAHQFMRMSLDSLRKVGKHYRQRFDDRVAIHLRLIPIFRSNPLRGNPIGRFNGFNAVNRFFYIIRFQSKQVIHKDFSSGNLLPLYFDTVFIGSETRGITKSDGRHYKAHILCVLPSENHDSLNESSSNRFIRKRNQAISEVHFNRLHLQEVVDIVYIFVIVFFALCCRFRLIFL